MTTTPWNVIAAERIAHQAHKGQIDKAGEPYIEHPRRVAGYLPLADMAGKAAAWLHDVLEDTPWTAEGLRVQKVPEEVVVAVVALTRMDESNIMYASDVRPEHIEPVESYYRRVAANDIAWRVKLADIRDNLDPIRMAKLDAVTQARLVRKYAKALNLLTTYRMEVTGAS